MKKFKFVFLLLAITLILTSCSANKSVDNSESAPSNFKNEIGNFESALPMEEAVGPDNVDSASEVQNTSENIQVNSRKIIVNYDLNLETKTYPEALAAINDLVKDYQGYHTSISESGLGVKYSQIQVQIPSDKAASFIDDVTNIENIKLLSKAMNSTDVTSQYTDVELRIKTLREKLDRLNELQKQQADLTSLIDLENEISNTIFEIERMEGQKSSLDGQIDYTEINISIEEIGSVAYTQTKPNFASRLSTAFTESFSNFVNGIQDLIITIIYAIPQILLLAIVVGIISLLFKFFFKKIRIKNLFSKKEKTVKIDDITPPKNDK